MSDMNLKEIISSTREYNFHSHTQFCDGRADMARFVAAAIEAGIKHYGFTPHSPIPVASPCNMKADRIDEYIAEFKRLKSLHGDKINLYLSMEIDYINEDWGASHSFFRSLPLDYRLSSVHFIPTADGSEMIDVDGKPASFIEKMHTYFDDDIRYVADTFYRQTLKMIEAGGFDIIGHFDKIGYNASCFSPGIEKEAWYQKHIRTVVDAIKETGLIAEVNTKAWLPPVNCSADEARDYQPRLFPSPSTIELLLKTEIPLAVNSDTHFPERVNAGRPAAFRIIDSLTETARNQS